MFHDAGDKAKLFTEIPSSFMSHTWGIDPAKFKTDEGLAKMFTMTSTSTDCIHDSTFVSSMESPDYPFQGVQFHPEKQIYQWNDDVGYNHYWDSVMINRYLADTFVKQARQNTNTYGDYETTQKAIIENYDFYVTDSYYGDVYMFN